MWLFIDDESSWEIDEAIVSMAFHLKYVDCKCYKSIKLFQIEYKSEFNEFDAMPISDLFIAKRHKTYNTTQWKLFDAYKLNHGYQIEITENGIIEAVNNIDGLKVSKANFSSTRRKNLKGVNITCGLVVFR